MRRLQDVLNPALGRDEVMRTVRARLVLQEWDDVVGSFLSARSRPDRYDKGTVWIAVEGSAWAQELRMMKDSILAKLQSRARDRDLFKDLRFGVRPMPTKILGDGTTVKPLFEVDKSLSIREIAEQRLRNWPGAPGA